MRKYFKIIISVPDQPAADGRRAAGERDRAVAEGGQEADGGGGGEAEEADRGGEAGGGDDSGIARFGASQDQGALVRRNLRPGASPTKQDSPDFTIVVVVRFSDKKFQVLCLLILPKLCKHFYVSFSRFYKHTLKFLTQNGRKKIVPKILVHSNKHIKGVFL
jgi:hypothetical protein